jgi:apolipoprotein D and lipocalin family protein
MRLLSYVLAGVIAVASPTARSAAVTAIDRIDLTRYAGQWHEIARLPMFFERACDRDITATYSLRADGTVSVHNACLEKSGKLRSAEGIARRPDPVQAPAKLQVRFAPAWLSFLPLVWADYWVIALDPDYRWAMVGEPRRKYLWILAREPTLDRATFEALKAKAQTMGYELAPLIVAGRISD